MKPGQAEITLPAWAGFQSRRGPYCSLSSDAISDGAAGLYVTIPYREPNDPQPPSPEQAAAFAHLIESLQAMRDAILSAVFALYPSWRDDFGMSDEEMAAWMPPLQDASGLRQLMGLSFVHVHDVSLGGMAYVGYEFGCNWEDEHGLSVMAHGTRIVEVGGADTAILGWIARRDAEAHGASGLG